MFEERGCVGCHGPAGIGAKAPAIAPLIAKVADPQLTQLLQSPNAKMKAGGMPPVAASPTELGSLVAYLRTLAAPKPGKEPVDSKAVENASASPEPPSPTTNASVPTHTNSPTAGVLPANATPGVQPTAGRAIFVSQGCSACHGPSGEGTHFAPSLIGVGKKFPGNALPTLLHHPTSKMRDGGMPTVKVNDAQMVQLVAYLSSLAPVSITTQGAKGNASATVPAPKSGSAAAGATAALPVQQVAAIPLSQLAQRGQKVFQSNSCESCHGIGGLTGTVAAPGLAGTASILPATVLEDLLRHLSIQMQKGGMPLTNMNAQDMKAVVAFIRSMPANGQ